MQLREVRSRTSHRHRAPSAGFDVKGLNRFQEHIVLSFTTKHHNLLVPVRVAVICHRAGILADTSNIITNSHRRELKYQVRYQGSCLQNCWRSSDYSWNPIGGASSLQLSLYSCAHPANATLHHSHRRKYEAEHLYACHRSRGP